MKNLLKLILIIVLCFSVNSCGVHWQYSTLNSTSYVDTLQSEGIAAEEINTVSQLQWKFQRDWDFANNYYAFLQQQNYSFFHNMYFQNRMHRFGWYSPHDYWMNWQYSWNSGYSYWNSVNQYPYYGNWNSNSWYYNQWNSQWGYSHIYGPRTQWLGNVYGSRYGRRSSNRNSLVYSNSSRSNLLLDSKVSTSEGRTYNSNTASLIENIIIRNNNKPRVLPNTKPVVVNSRPPVINKPPRNNNIWKPTINNSKPIIRNNNNSRPVINNSSSRPNFNSNSSRPSSPKINSTTNRKGNNPR